MKRIGTTVARMPTPHPARETDLIVGSRPRLARHWHCWPGCSPPTQCWRHPRTRAGRSGRSASSSRSPPAAAPTPSRASSRTRWASVWASSWSSRTASAAAASSAPSGRACRARRLYARACQHHDACGGGRADHHLLRSGQGFCAGLDDRQFAVRAGAPPVCRRRPEGSGRAGKSQAARAQLCLRRHGDAGASLGRTVRAKGRRSSSPMCPIAAPRNPCST